METGICQLPDGEELALERSSSVPAQPETDPALLLSSIVDEGLQ